MNKRDEQEGWTMRERDEGGMSSEHYRPRFRVMAP